MRFLNSQLSINPKECVRSKCLGGGRCVKFLNDEFDEATGNRQPSSWKLLEAMRMLKSFTISTSSHA